MGTPDFATGILSELIQNQIDIVAVVTSPDKPAGRGRKLQFSSVKQFALAHKLPVLQPTNLKNPDFLTELASYKADLQIVVAFRMLPKEVWAMPALGTFNLHASLLPLYRGAAPINWAIINGEEKTGITTFFIDNQIDTGEIILQKEVEISARETAGTLHDKLMHQGAKLVIETVKLIENQQVKTSKQPNLSAKNAPKIYKDTCRIDWQKSLHEIDAFIRGLSPYPTAWSFFRNENEQSTVKIFQASPVFQTHNLPIGKIIVEQKNIKVACKEGFLLLESLQFPSKKRMNSQEILNGFNICNYFLY